MCRCAEEHIPPSWHLAVPKHSRFVPCGGTGCVRAVQESKGPGGCREEEEKRTKGGRREEEQEAEIAS